jgi:hypothetical protein
MTPRWRWTQTLIKRTQGCSGLELRKAYSPTRPWTRRRNATLERPEGDPGAVAWSR